MIRIRHVYESMYLHLSRMFVRAGPRVGQGQRIGAVGATGIVSGPHPDFRLRRNGQYVNFERFNPPRATKLTTERMEASAADRDRFAALMDSGLPSASTTVAEATPPAAATASGGN